MTPLFILCVFYAADGWHCQPESPRTEVDCISAGKDDVRDDPEHQKERGFRCVPAANYKE